MQSKREYKKEWRDKNREKVREYSRVKTAEWVENNREKWNKYMRKRAKDWRKNNPELAKIKDALKIRYRKKNDPKDKARGILNRAIKSGKIVRPNICSKCLEPKRVQGHHFDYEKPLEVIWLCQKCHSLEHHPL